MKITQFWRITKIGFFSISQGEILFSILQILFSINWKENMLRDKKTAIICFSIISNYCNNSTTNRYHHIGQLRHWRVHTRRDNCCAYL